MASSFYNLNEFFLAGVVVTVFAGIGTTAGATTVPILTMVISDGVAGDEEIYQAANITTSVTRSYNNNNRN